MRVDLSPEENEMEIVIARGRAFGQTLTTMKIKDVKGMALDAILQQVKLLLEDLGARKA